MGSNQPIRELLIYHHSHLDVGYTHHPDTVWARQGDYLRLAMDLAERYAERPEGERFKWTAESSAVVERFLQSASTGEIDRFVRLSQAGLIETTAMFCNTTPLFTASELWASLGVMQRLRRDFGLTIESAVNHDVNGAAWILPKVLGQLGIRLLVMGINQDSARAPLPRPRAFWWEGREGERLLTWNGEHYGYAQYVGIPRPKAWTRGTADLTASQQQLDAYLDRIVGEGYPYDFLVLSVTNTVTWDNDAPNEELVQFVQAWNQSGRSPRLSIVTPRDVSGYLHRQPAGTIPVRRGDWTDWWADGVGSTARETALALWTGRMWEGARILAGLSPLLSEADRREFSRLDAEVLRHLWLYNEHTWGSAQSISRPDTVNGRGQWIAKASHAYEGAAGAHRLWTLASRGLAAAIEDDGEPSVMVFNPLPWDARVRAVLPHFREAAALGGAFPLQELARDIDLANPVSPDYVAGPPTDYGLVSISALSYRTLPLRAPNPEAKSGGERWTLTSPWLKATVDPATGALSSLITRADGREWGKPGGDYGLGEYVYHRLMTPRGRRDLQPPRPAEDVRSQWAIDERRVTRVIEQSLIPGPGLASMRLKLDAAGMRSLEVTYTVYDDEPWLDLHYRFDKGEARGIESVYVVFPLNLKAPDFHYASAGTVIQGETDQLANACRDYYSVENWADLSDPDGGLTLATPDAPLVLWGGFTVGAYAERHSAAESCLVGWVMNNKWHTNFRHAQPGVVEMRYRVWAHSAPFDPVAAQVFGLTTAMPLMATPVMRGEAAMVTDGLAPRQADRGQWLKVSPAHVRIIELTPVLGEENAADAWRIGLQLLAPVDQGSLAWSGPGRSLREAWITDWNTGRRLAPLSVANGTCHWSGQAGEWVAMELRLSAGRTTETTG